MNKVWRAACIGFIVMLLWAAAWFATPGSSFQMMRVQAGSAKDSARVLDEAYNGSGPGRILVFAIPTTEIVFVKADSADLATIRVLLKPVGVECE